MKSHSRTTGWCWLFALLLCAGVACAKSPNVVMISVDDLNDWIAPLGGYRGTIHTPNSDRLASKGMLFLNAHCPSPVCNPSRTSILLGLRPSTTGIYGNSQWWRPTFPNAVSMPSHFKNNGYITLGAGKVHHHNSGHNPPDQWDAYRRQTYDELWEKQNVMEATLRPPEERTPPPSEFPLNGLTEAVLGSRRPVYPPSFDWGGLSKTAGQPANAPVKRELARWLPKIDAPDAPDAPDRGAYDFDLATYSWTPKANAATKPAAAPGSIQRSFTGGSQ